MTTSPPPDNLSANSGTRPAKDAVWDTESGKWVAGNATNGQGQPSAKVINADRLGKCLAELRVIIIDHRLARGTRSKLNRIASGLETLNIADIGKLTEIVEELHAFLHYRFLSIETREKLNKVVADLQALTGPQALVVPPSPQQQNNSAPQGRLTNGAGRQNGSFDTGRLEEIATRLQTIVNSLPSLPSSHLDRKLLNEILANFTVSGGINAEQFGIIAADIRAFIRGSITITPTARAQLAAIANGLNAQVLPSQQGHLDGHLDAEQLEEIVVNLNAVIQSLHSNHTARPKLEAIQARLMAPDSNNVSNLKAIEEDLRTAYRSYNLSVTLLLRVRGIMNELRTAIERNHNWQLSPQYADGNNAAAAVQFQGTQSNLSTVNVYATTLTQSQQQNGLAVAGFVCSLVGLLFSMVGFFLAVFGWNHEHSGHRVFIHCFVPCQPWCSTKNNVYLGSGTRNCWNNSPNHLGHPLDQMDQILDRSPRSRANSGSTIWLNYLSKVARNSQASQAQ